MQRHPLAPATLLALALAASGCADEPVTGPRADKKPPGEGPRFQVSASPASDPVIAAVGDIVCGAATDPANPCQHEETSDLLGPVNPDVVLPLGDNQYPHGQLADFQNFYAPTWGLFKSKTRPVPGNHEYGTIGAAGYFDYFNGVGKANGLAGRRGRGYYSYDLGSWHVIALNSNIARGATSAQVTWLKADLAANPYACTLAYWHHARFSSGPHGDDVTVEALWQALYDGGADVILAAHDHAYERFAPQTATGSFDGERGIRSFVVGTGGKELYPFGTIRPNSEVRSSAWFGVLQMTLKPGGYDWRFVPVANSQIPGPGGELPDEGSAACRGGAALGFTPTADAQVAAPSSLRNRNFGGAVTMTVDGSPIMRSLLRFTVQGVGASVIASAKLRLYAANGSVAGGRVHEVTGTWDEGTVTWATQPAFDPTPFTALAAVTGKQWAEVDVTSRVTGDGDYSFALTSTSADAAIYATREAEAWNAPRLVIGLQ